MSDRLGQYESKAEVGGIEELSKKLTEDLRKHIRSLQLAEIFTEKWNAVAASLSRIGTIAEMEQQLPKEKDASLWECEELALRFVLEDGKLNLCLRLLDDFVSAKVQMMKGKLSPEENDVENMDKFESGIGLLLKNAWSHSEALQISDMHLVFQIIGTILQLALLQKEKPKTKRSLNHIVIYFLHAIGSALDKIDEDTVMANLERHNIFENLLKHLDQNREYLENKDLLTGCQAASFFINAEEFKIRKSTFVTPTVKETLVDLEKNVVEGVAGDYSVKKTIRPLLDLIALAK